MSGIHWTKLLQKFSQRTQCWIPSLWCRLDHFVNEVILCHGDSFSGINTHRGIFCYQRHCSSIERFLKQSFLNWECINLDLPFFLWQWVPIIRRCCKSCIANIGGVGWLGWPQGEEARENVRCVRGRAPQGSSHHQKLSHEPCLCQSAKLILGPHTNWIVFTNTYKCLCITNTKIILGLLNWGWGNLCTGCQLNWIISLIPARTLPYEYTDSYGISFKNMHVYFQPVAEVMVQHMCGCHHDVWCIWPHTWIFWIYLQDTKIRHDCMSYLTSVIGEFSKLRHFASYVSRHNAMVYDTCPHKWSYQRWTSCEKKTYQGKKITIMIWVVMWDVRIVLP